MRGPHARATGTGSVMCTQDLGFETAPQVVGAGASVAPVSTLEDCCQASVAQHSVSTRHVSSRREVCSPTSSLTL